MFKKSWNVERLESLKSYLYNEDKRKYLIAFGMAIIFMLIAWSQWNK